MFYIACMGRLLGFHFLIVVLKTLAVFKSLNSYGTNCHMSGPRYDIQPDFEDLND